MHEHINVIVARAPPTTCAVTCAHFTIRCHSLKQIAHFPRLQILVELFEAGLWSSVAVSENELPMTMDWQSQLDTFAS